MMFAWFCAVGQAVIVIVTIPVIGNYGVGLFLFLLLFYCLASRFRQMQSATRASKDKTVVSNHSAAVQFQVSLICGISAVSLLLTTY